MNHIPVHPDWLSLWTSGMAFGYSPASLDDGENAKNRNEEIMIGRGLIFDIAYTLFRPVHMQTALSFYDKLQQQ